MAALPPPVLMIVPGLPLAGGDPDVLESHQPSSGRQACCSNERHRKEARQAAFIRADTVHQFGRQVTRKPRAARSACRAPILEGNRSMAVAKTAAGQSAAGAALPETASSSCFFPVGPAGDRVLRIRPRSTCMCRRISPGRNSYTQRGLAVLRPCFAKLMMEALNYCPGGLRGRTTPRTCRGIATI